MANRQFSEIEYLTGLRSNDSAVIRVFYKTHYPMIMKLIIGNNGTEQEAKDIFQESVIVLFNKLKQPDFVLNCKLQTYIYSVSKNLWLKQLNKKSGHVSLMENQSDEGNWDVADEVNEHEEKEKQYAKVNNSLNAIGEPCKSLINDFYVGKLSMEQIASKYGYTNSENAKTQKYKCLQRLKRSFFE